MSNGQRGLKEKCSEEKIIFNKSNNLREISKIDSEVAALIHIHTHTGKLWLRRHLW